MKPVMLYDGDCGFCRRWIERWKHITAGRIEYRPYQEAGADYPDIPQADFRKSVQYLDAQGKRYSGAEAVFRALAVIPSYRWPLAAYEKVPGVAFFSESFYKLVASHRVLFSTLTRFFFEPPSETASYTVSRWVFLRGLAIVYFIAFSSLYVQIDGLIGSRGILPAQTFLEAVSARFGAERFHLVPTLAWIDSSDGFLRMLCLMGMAASLLLMAGIASVPVLFFLWTAYLSFLPLGRDFLSFQWDILLLETGFLAIFLSTWHFFPEPLGKPHVPRAVHLLFRWLLFRLMFSSGAVKFMSGDPTWRNLSALSYHYETQPIPAWTSWYVHQLPGTYHAASAALMFGIELVIPFFIFGPRPLRLFASWALISLQAMILTTGNYGFFNWLSILLCLFLWDDAYWPVRFRQFLERLYSLFPRRVRKKSGGNKTAGAKNWPKPVVFPLFFFLLTLSSVPLLRLFRTSDYLPASIAALRRWTAPFYLVNHYGLFAVMTTRRPEIIVEGSLDGTRWLPYHFKHKPGDLASRPGFVAPHQPRLDWQMWFAALSDYRRNPWFVNFCIRLLEASPPVLRLLEEDPFQGKPPRYIRALIYDYQFTNFQERGETGQFWKRGEGQVYLPAIALRQGSSHSTGLEAV